MTVPFIYISDKSGALQGPVELPEIPGLGVQLPAGSIELDRLLPEPVPGNAWALVDGQVHQLPDFRGITYSTADGAAVQYGLLGDLPKDLTLLLRPSADHAWTGSAWEFSLELQAENRLALTGRLCKVIDAAADAARSAVAGDSLRALEYLRATNEAKAFAAAGYPADGVPGYVAAWAIGGLTPQQAADDILREAGLYDGALLQLRQLRLAAKVQLRQLIQVGDIEQAEQLAASTAEVIRTSVAGICEARGGVR